jgi:hypothetical protein
MATSRFGTDLPMKTRKVTWKRLYKRLRMYKTYILKLTVKQIFLGG